MSALKGLLLRRGSLAPSPFWACLCLMFFVFAAPIVSAGESVIFVEDSQKSIALGPSLEYLEDKDGSLTIDDLVAGKVDDQWFKIEGSRASFGFSPSVYWMKGRFNFVSRRNGQLLSDRWLMFDYVLHDYIDVYVVAPHGQLLHYPLGDQRDFSNNPFDSPHFIAPLTLTKGDITDVYIRIESGGAKLLGVSLHNFTALTNAISDARMRNGLFYGVMIIMVLYNLLIYISIGDRTYLYYVLGITSFGLTQASLDGIPWQYQLFDDPHWNNQIVPLLMSSTWIFLLAFSRSLLDVAKLAPLLDMTIKFMAVVFFWSACLSFLLDYSEIVQLNSRLTLLYAILLSGIGLHLWRRGHRQGRYYVFAWSAYMVGVLSQILYVFGAISNNAFVENGASWGGFANVLLLSLALADRINTQKRETEEARQRALDAKQEAEQANATSLANMNKFKNLFDNAAEGIFQCSMDGRFLTLNPAYSAIFGYESPEAMKAAIESIGDQCFKNPDDYDAIVQILLKLGRIADIEAECVRQDGSTFWCTSSVSLVRDSDGNALYFEGFLIDITEKKEKEMALRDREAAQASAQAKSEFLANMSHEIRTPMNAIIGFAALSQKTNLNPQQRDYIRKIESSSKNLLGIINDILDFSKIEAGKLDLERVEFSFNDVINDVVSMLCHKSAEKQIELVVSIQPGVPLRLLGDPLRLEQILINLANNAIKFTDEGEVVIRVSDISRLDNKVQLQFSVEDTGIGISKEQQQRLFKPFSQADGSTTRKYGGTGLGLTISKQLVELMDGDIWVTSEANKGSKFQFNAWFGEPVARDGMPNSVYESKELKGLRVLLIDDKDSGQEALVEILTSFECQTRWVQPDYTLIDKLREEVKSTSYDLVVIDRQLAAMSSIDAALGVRGLTYFADVPIIVMSLSNEDKNMEEITEYGFVCMVKPVTPSVMLDAIQDIFGYTGPRASRRTTAEDDERVLKILRGARVLLVEDTPFNQEIATEFLRQVSIDVVIASNGMEAVDILENETFDAIIMDCQMPVMDGFEATRRIRHQLGLVDLPIIAMTANAMKGDKLKCLKAGMSDYISKPVVPAKLYAVLAHWLSPRARLQASEQSLLAELGDASAVDAEQRVDFSEVLEAEESSPVQTLQEAVKQVRSQKSDTQAKEKSLPADGESEYSIPIVEPDAADIEQLEQVGSSIETNAETKAETNTETEVETEVATKTEADMIEPESAGSPDHRVHVIDIDEALVNMGGSRELLDRMLQSFRKEQADSLDELIASFDAGDKNSAHRQAHTLKGIAASICAHELRHSMAELEEALERGAIDTRIEQLFCEADNAFKQVMAYIDNLKEDA
ncbi:MAG: response regulator [Hahellaceae bacterium]|nr:response regulator [Hahellaceae bacterium]MCP5210928.1 response regulator [Hahellaceae bacterium]